MQLQRASREKVKMRMSISSPTGFGKTYSSLLIAHGMTGDWSKICVIDTENNSASLYADLGYGNTYFTIPIEPPFTPEKYIEAIDVCEKNGIEVIIIDSATHVWKGEGGLLEYNNSLGGKYQDWAKTTPRYQKWLNKILHSSCHTIITMRKKQAYALVTEGGKTKVEKKGMEDEIRDGFDYEMTIAFEVVNDKHMVVATKDRTRLFVGLPEFVVTEEAGKQILDWCETGLSLDDMVKDAINKLGKCDTINELTLLKETLPSKIRTNEGFKDAAIMRFNVINNKQTA
jgi:hypothetical protein